MKHLSILVAVLFVAMCLAQAAPVPDEIFKAVDEVAVDNGLHPRKTHYLLEQFVPAAGGDEEQRKQLARALMEAFASQKTTTAGRTIIAQHLAKVAGEAEVKALKNIKGDAQLMADVRIALNELASSSYKDAGKDVYLAELKSGDAAKQIAGLAGLLRYYPKDAAKIAPDYLQNMDAQVSATAMRILAEIKPASFAKVIESLPKPAQLMALSIAAEKEISAVGEIVGKLAAGTDEELRIAAINTLGVIGSKDSVPVLASAGAVEALANLNARGVDKAVLKVIKSGDVSSQVTAIKAAILRDTPKLDSALINVAASSDGKVASEALKVLGRAGDTSIYAEVCALLGGANSEDAVSATRRMIKRIDDDKAVMVPLNKAFSGSDNAKKIAVLQCLSASGCDEALSIVNKGNSSVDKDIADASIRALTQWPDPAAVSMLKKIAADKDSSIVHRSLCERAIKRFESGGARLSALASLNCGVENSVKGRTGVQLKVIKGKSWKYTDEPAGTIAFDGSEVVIEINGLKPNKKYQLGFVWWDYDNNGRVQSVQVGKMKVLGKTALPAWKGKKEPAVALAVNIPTSEIKGGKATIRFKREAAANCVVSEIWVTEGQASGVPVPQPVVVAAVIKKRAKPAKADPKKFGPPVLKANKGAARKVLIVTGNEYPGHPWRKTAPAMVKVLAEDKTLEISYTEDYTILASKDIFKYDTLFLNYQNDGEPGPDGALDNLTKYVKGGGGMTLFHFACGAFIGHPKQVYNSKFMEIAGRSWNPKLRGHDPFGKFMVNIADKNHPITKGMKDFEQTDELYTCLDGDFPVHIVASAISKVDKKVYPMAFTCNPGKGRDFHCVLGHNLKSFNSSANELYRRGAAWSAGL
jgi:type 1 glutamine amidotransferase/HEAT repeat protein